MRSLSYQLFFVMLAITFLIVPAGCAALQQAFGMRMSLEDEAVDSIEASLYGDIYGVDALCPGYGAHLGVSILLSEGTFHETEGAADGRVGWENFQISTEGAIIGENGYIKLAADPFETLNEPAIVDIHSIHHEGVSDQLEIPARYDCDFGANFSGTNGRDGAIGRSGSSGSRGKSQSSSSNSAGGTGQRGADGGHGANGEHGRVGQDVEIFVDILDDNEPLLVVVEVESLTTGNSRVFLFDPDQGQVIVSVRGGQGGRGGNGGGGGTGGAGGTGNPNGNGGDGGNGGNGGVGADGGDGGSAVIIASEDAEPYLDFIAVDNRGGSGGAPGQAGFGGGGGNAHSGAHSGNRGQSGVPGSRSGRDGRDGPPVQVEIVGRGGEQ